MADLLDRVVIEVQRKEEHEREPERQMMDPGALVLLDEVTAIIADRLGRLDTSEREMMWLLDGVPMSIILMAADQLGVTVRGAVWRIKRWP